MADSPVSERVARELVPVLREDPEAVEEVWAEVVEEHGSAPTAAQVRATVERSLGPRAIAKARAVLIKSFEGVGKARATIARTYIAHPPRLKQ